MWRKALFILVLTSCQVKVDVSKGDQDWYDDSTQSQFVRGIDAYLNKQYSQADSLLTAVIAVSKDNLSVGMPIEMNPYYYRGHTYIELEKYKEALLDFEKVASDTTSNTDVLLARSEAYKMLGDYENTVAICNRLISLKVDSFLCLSQRGLAYYQMKEMSKACLDLTYVKSTGRDSVGFLDVFIKDCK